MCEKSLAPESFFKMLFSLVLIMSGLITPTILQADTWRNYTFSNYIYDLTLDENYLWAATLGGVICWDLTTNSYEEYSVKNGLLDNYVTSVAIDPNGNKWLGTRSGLSVLNGNTFKFYKYTNNNFQIFQVCDIAFNDSGNVWIGTAPGGAFYYDYNTWTVYDTGPWGPTDIDHNDVCAVEIDQSGNVWFGSHWWGASRFDGNSWTHYNESNGILPGPGARAIETDQDGNVWISTYMDGVCKYDGLQWTTYTTNDGLIANSAISMLNDQNGNIWFGTRSSGISRFDGTNWTSYTKDDGLLSNNVCGIAIDSSGNMYFGGDSGISRFDGESWSYFRTPITLSDPYVSEIAIDHEGNKWFGTGNGICKFDGTSWETITQEADLANTEVKAIAIEDTGIVWVGTYYSGVRMFDGSSWTTYSTNNGLAHNYIRDIVIDDSNNIWFATEGGGVSKYDGATWSNYTTANGLVSNNVQAIYIDAEGNLWFAAYGGASKFDGATWTNYEASDGLVSQYVNDIVVDSSGNVWFATSDGISQYDGTYWTTHDLDDLESDNMRCVDMDSEGNIWFGCSGHLLEYNGSNWTAYGTPDGLTDRQINALAIDNSDHKWIGTFGGVSEFYTSTQKINTEQASNIMNDSATLNGTINPDGLNTTYYFQYGTTSYLDNTTSPASAGSGTVDVKVSTTLSNLSSNRTYYYRLVAINSNGATYGSKMTFATSSPSIAHNVFAALAPSCTQGNNSSSQTFDIWNSGGGTLSYTISDNQIWLSCTPSSGTSAGEHDIITVNYTTSSLTPGTYTATITIFAAGASNTPQTIPVNLTVTYSLTDSDGDGVYDSLDHCPNTPAGETVDVNGCSSSQWDSDGDTHVDSVDVFPDDPLEWADSDGDGKGDNSDIDPSNPCEWSVPDKPSIIVPDYYVDVPVKCTIEASDFYDADNGTHYQTEWEIRDVNAEVVVLSSKNGTCLTVLDVPAFVLNPHTSYACRVRYYDASSNASEWSDAIAFLTELDGNDEINGNGIPDDQEAEYDWDGDGNIDNNIITLSTVLDNGTAEGDTVVVGLVGVENVSSITSVMLLDPNDIADTVNRPDSLPFGLVCFKVEVIDPSVSAFVDIYLEEPAPADAGWYKYDELGGWREYGHATFLDDGLTVRLELKDGDTDFGDIDGVVNYYIVDPSGVGVSESQVVPEEDEEKTPLLFGGGGSGGKCFIDAASNSTVSASGIGTALFISMIFLGIFVKRVKYKG